MATILRYRYASSTSPSTVSKKLFGYTDHSNGGRYVYERKGLLDMYSYRRVGKGALVVDQKQKDAVKKVMRSQGLAVEEVRL